MAWIHPQTNGDYTLIGVSTGTGYGNEGQGIFSTLVYASVGTDLNAVASSGWGVLASFDPYYGAAEAATELGTRSHNIYNTNGDIIASDDTDLWSGTITNAVEFTIASPYSSVGAANIWTGTDTAGTTSEALGIDDPGGKNSCTSGTANSATTPWMNNTSTPSGNEYQCYGFSPVISTISGSLSGTISRVNTEIWAVGSITLTGDIDFGVAVDIAPALDATQTPTIVGAGVVIDVGVGGTFDDSIKRTQAVANAGTNNQVGSSAGGISVKYGV